MEIKPDIIIPQIPESGAIELANIFSQHSQISTIDYFQNPMHGNNVRAGQALMDAIRHTKPSYTTLLNDNISSKYALKITKHYPDSQYIIVVKDPFQRMINDWEKRAYQDLAPLSLSSYLQQALNQLMNEIGVSHYDALLEMIEFYNHWTDHEQPNLSGSATVITHGFYDQILLPYQNNSRHMIIAPAEQLNHSAEKLIQYYLHHFDLKKETLKPCKQNRRSLSNILRHSNIVPMAKTFLPAVFFTENKPVKVTLPAVNDLAQHPYLYNVISQIYRIMNKKTHQLLRDQFDIEWQYKL